MRWDFEVVNNSLSCERNTEVASSSFHDFSPPPPPDPPERRPASGAQLTLCRICFVRRSARRAPGPAHPPLRSGLRHLRATALRPLRRLRTPTRLRGPVPQAARSYHLRLETQARLPGRIRRHKVALCAPVERVVWHRQSSVALMQQGARDKLARHGDFLAAPVGGSITNGMPSCFYFLKILDAVWITG